jgi:hypothetical protein
MRSAILLLGMLLSSGLAAQAHYGTPEEGELPEELKHLPLGIEVLHFPKENHPVKIKNTYFWKHATGILCNSDDITITEFGAYVYYNNQWNLRKKYELKDLDRYFGTKNNQLLQGQPYVWPDNWRRGKELFGGWALWYFIGTTNSGTTICGYATIHTTDKLLNQ